MRDIAGQILANTLSAEDMEFNCGTFERPSRELVDYLRFIMPTAFDNASKELKTFSRGRPVSNYNQLLLALWAQSLRRHAIEKHFKEQVSKNNLDRVFDRISRDRQASLKKRNVPDTAIAQEVSAHKRMCKRIMSLY